MILYETRCIHQIRHLETFVTLFKDFREYVTLVQNVYLAYHSCPQLTIAVAMGLFSSPTLRGKALQQPPSRIIEKFPSTM